MADRTHGLGAAPGGRRAPVMRLMLFVAIVLLLPALAAGHAGQSPTPAEKNADFWMKRLADSAETPASNEAFAALAALGSDALSALTKGLGDRDPHVRFQAFLLIRRLEPKNAEHADALLAAFDWDDGDLRTAVFEHLARLGKPAVPALRRAARHSWIAVNSEALSLLTSLDPEAALAEVTRAKGLDQPHLDVVAKLGPRARPAVPALLRLARSPGESVWIKEDPTTGDKGYLAQVSHRPNVVAILAATGDQRCGELVPHLLGPLRDWPDWPQQENKKAVRLNDIVQGRALDLRAREHDVAASLRSLAELGPLAADAMPSLRAFLSKGSTRRFHPKVVHALIRLGADPQPLLPYLLSEQAQADEQTHNLLVRHYLDDPGVRGRWLRQVIDPRLPLERIKPAAHGLLALRPRHHAMLPDLEKALAQTNDPGTQQLLICAMARLGPVAIPALRRQLHLADDLPRQRALIELLRFTPRDPGLLRRVCLECDGSANSYSELPADVPLRRSLVDADALLPYLADIDPRVRCGALVRLNHAEFDPSLRAKVFRGALADPSTRVRVAAGYGVGTLGRRAAVSMSELTALLAADDEESYYAAINSFHAVGPLPVEIAPTLARKGGQELLGFLGKRARPALEAALTDPNPQQRAWVVRLLRTAGDQSSAAKVRPLLCDPDVRVRHEAALTLPHLDPSDAACLPILMELLEEEEDGNDLLASAALEKLGPRAAPALDRIEQLFLTPNQDRSAYMAKVLVTTGPAALPVLRANWQHQSINIRRLAVYGLAMAKAPGRVEDLVAVLQGGQEDMRVLAARWLGELGPDARAAVPELRRALREDRAPVRNEAAIALARIAGRHPEAAKVLTALLEGDEPGTNSTRDFREAFLERHEFSPLHGLVLAAEPEALPPLLAKYFHKNRDNDRGARALGALARLGPPALPHLRLLMRHPDSAVRWRTAAALSQWSGGSDSLERLVTPWLAQEPLKSVRDSLLATLAQRQAAPQLALPWLRDQVLADLQPFVTDEDEIIVSRLRTEPNPFGTGRVGSTPGKAKAGEDHWNANDLLRAYGPAAVPILLPALEHAQAPARARAAHLLGQIGPSAKAALPTLYALAQRETHREVRREMWMAQESIRGLAK